MGAEPTDLVVSRIDSTIRRAIDARASDIHFEPTDQGLVIRFRIDALLQTIENLPSAIAPNVIARLKVLAGLLTYRTDIPQEGAVKADAGFGRDLRVATFPTLRGERAVVRLMAGAGRLLGLSELGFDDALLARLRRLISAPQGLVLVCGPAGSGKTTTLFAILACLLCDRPGVSILSVEDPAEIRLDGVTQIEIAPARGLTYPIALRSLLRQDPQVLMVGEIRDVDTAKIVVEAALTGHLLLSTIHGGSPAEAIVRLREMGIAPYQLTSTLSGILSQRLVRRICAECSGAPVQSGTPCPRCLGAGFSGRTAVAHLVEMTDDLRRAILESVDARALAESCAATGDLASDARRVLATGHTTDDEIRRVIGD